MRNSSKGQLFSRDLILILQIIIFILDIHLTIFAMVLISDKNHITNGCRTNFICEYENF